MFKFLVILIVALVFEAVGVVYLSRGLKQIGTSPSISVPAVGRLVAKGVANPNILLGVLLEAIFFCALLFLLSQAEVSLVWPLTSLGYVLTTLAARFILHEPVTLTRWFGVLAIVIGAMLVAYGEKSDKRLALIQTESGGPSSITSQPPADAPLDGSDKSGPAR